MPLRPNLLMTRPRTVVLLSLIVSPLVASPLPFNSTIGAAVNPGCVVPSMVTGCVIRRQSAVQHGNRLRTGRLNVEHDVVGVAGVAVRLVDRLSQRTRTAVAVVVTSIVRPTPATVVDAVAVLSEGSVSAPSLVAPLVKSSVAPPSARNWNWNVAVLLPASVGKVHV